MPRKNARAQWSQFLKSGQRPIASTTPALANKSVFTGTLLGIDPSVRGMGLALIHASKPECFELRFSRTLKLSRTLSFHDCLGEIAQETEHCITQMHPDIIAVEETIYVQNFRTAQALGAARGAALAAAARRKIPIFEYAPLRIKQAIVGRGRASKEQVAGMVRQLLRHSTPLPPDESDAAAVAICHALTCSA